MKLVMKCKCGNDLKSTEHKLEGKDINLNIYQCDKCNKFYTIWLDGSLDEVHRNQDSTWQY